MSDLAKKAREYADRMENGPYVHLKDTRDLLRSLADENERLNKDADRFNYLEAECNDLVCVAEPIADTGDADTVWEVAGHFMQKPHRRILAVSKDIRRAIDKAMEVDQ